MTCTLVTDGAACAEFDQLESKQDYEDLVHKAVRGVPPHWAPEIAAQCLYAPTSSNGKR